MRGFVFALTLSAAALALLGMAAALLLDSSERRERRFFNNVDKWIRAGAYETAEIAIVERYSDEAGRPAEAWLRMGICRSMREDFAAAERLFDFGLDADPDDARLLYNRALLYARMGRAADAERELLRVKHLAPYFPEVYYHLGRLAEERGDAQRARQLYVEELNLNPASQSAWKRHFLLSEGRASAPESKEEKDGSP
ncbi:MAG: Tetratricopeptide repeat protein [candidate division BRC1 bacterium ADurb.BinA364]|nr:MAG: Tetratricopeptide repeat protein [candidate division BRC1 bacterium ADurb.BinA364]